MTLSVHAAIAARISINHFQPNRPLSDGDITVLVELATKAPSAYNMQNWRFIAVRSDAAKARLQSAAFGQKKITDASAVFLVCGTLEAHKHLALALAPCVQTGLMTAEMVQAWQTQAEKSHENNPVLQRDEAFRSASLAAMALMLAAQGMGLGSCAMSGFDPVLVAQAFGLSAKEVPVLLVAVGYPEAGNWPQKPRKAVSEVLAIL
ncbi:MAG: nitroreductase family protein [Comamonas sp.]|nr:nitroreductase family protein [Comamonas sp.]